MVDRKKPEIRFSLVPTLESIDEESRSFWSRSPSQVVQPGVPQEKPPVTSSRTLKTPYTPPDSLMFPLFSAIQRKEWSRAKRLSHELILCDPERKIYHDLYVRLDQITDIIDQRFHPQSAVSEGSITSSDDDDRSSRE